MGLKETYYYSKDKVVAAINALFQRSKGRKRRDTDDDENDLWSETSSQWSGTRTRYQSFDLDDVHSHVNIDSDGDADSIEENEDLLHNRQKYKFRKKVCLNKINTTMHGSILSKIIIFSIQVILNYSKPLQA